MQRSCFTLAAKTLMIFAVVPAVMLANASGPPPGHTGAPGDLGTCTACHTGSAVNTTGLAITAAQGVTYTPGQRQRITIAINASPAANRYGFQATARLVSNLMTGQAGTLQPSSGETQVFCANERPAPCPTNTMLQFIEHTSPKPSNTFEFDWTPPDTDVGPIRLYAAANAANGDTRESGDRIFTGNLTLNPAAASGPRPTINSDGVINGATNQPGITSGSWAAIKGSNFSTIAAPGRIWTQADFDRSGGLAPIEMEGARVTIDGKPAAIWFVSAGQLNVQVPNLDKTGNVAVEVTNANGASNTVTAEVRRAAPGWFVNEVDGKGYIAGQHPPPSYTRLGRVGLFGPSIETLPAKPGDTIVLYGGNFGPTNPAIPERAKVTAASPLIDTPRVTIGGVQATVTYAGGAPDLIGTYQFNITVPDVPNGDQAVVVELPGGLRTQENAFITIQR